MSTPDKILRGLICSLSEENYDETFAKYRLWLDIGITYGYLNDKDQVANDIREILQSSLLRPEDGDLIHPANHLYLRFVRDIEADPTMSAQVPELARSFEAAVDRCFGENLSIADRDDDVVRHQYRYQSDVERLARERVEFARQINLVACWANLGYVKRVVVWDHILQSLTSHPKLYNHQADAIIILFKIAGGTFGTITDPSVVDCCLELLKNHSSNNASRSRLVQEVLDLRERNWEGLPPPPALATEKLASTSTGQKDPSATPVAVSLGLPNRGPEPQILQHPVPEPVTAPETEAISASPVTQSPTISISTFSDFTIADTSDDEPPTDPTTITPHDTFNFEDGNVEVLCGNTLFRIHTSILSLHSPSFRRMFAQTSLATAESPNGCPRIQSPDAAIDFATLLKTIYLPGFPERGKVPDFKTFSSLLRMTTKYEMPAVRSQLLEIIRDAYPETFGALTPTKLLGEATFPGPNPHPNEVLGLFVQQEFTSALPMAYYMAVRRGVDSLMDRHLPPSATLSPGTLQSAVKGLIALRQLELDETYNLVLGLKAPHQCSSAKCPSRTATGPRVSDAHKKVIDWITASSRSGTKVLEVLSLRKVLEVLSLSGDDPGGFCESCVKEWEAGHAEVRKRAWDMLQKAFGLKG